MKATEITYSFDSADAIKGFSLDEAHKAGIDFKVLDKKLADMGFSMDSSVLADAKYMDIVKSYAQDDGLALGGGNIPGLAQFFQFCGAVRACGHTAQHLIAERAAAWIHQLSCPAQQAARNTVVIHQSFLTATMTRTRLPAAQPKLSYQPVRW